MLSSFIINSLNTCNIMYLWTILTKKNNNIFKLVLSILIASISTTVIDRLELNFIIMHIMIILVIKIIYKIDLKQAILGFFLVLVIVISLELIFSLFINRLVYDYTNKAIIVESILLISIMIFSKINLFSKNFIFENRDNVIFIYSVLICSIYTILFKVSWHYDNIIILNNLFYSSLIFGVLSISQVLIYLYFVKIVKEKEALKISNEYKSVIDEIVQEIRQRQHDFVNYKNSIWGMVEVLEEKELKEGIRNYMKDEDIYDDKTNELIYIDNVVVRSIIYRNMCRAKKYNINFEYKVENNVLEHILNYHELSNVLNNLLNNAFDEVMKEGCIEKNIEIKIFNKNKESHLIVKNQIVNPNDININEIFIRGYSTKSTGTRGYGLYNVQQIVNLHKGYIKISVECKTIIFDIYFNNSSG